jgi:hypothetical protein
MKTGFGQLLLMFLVLFCECVSAQTDTGTPDTSGPKPAYTYQDQTPPTQPGPQPAFTYPDTTPSLDFLSESIENSSITLGIMTGFPFPATHMRQMGQALTGGFIKSHPASGSSNSFPNSRGARDIREAIRHITIQTATGMRTRTITCSRKTPMPASYGSCPLIGS